MDAIFVVMLVILGLIVASALLEWLWNITMPQTFRLLPINMWIAFRLILIGSLITGGGFIRFNF